MRASHYAKALFALHGEDQEGSLVKRFLEIVRTNGHTHLLAKILRSYEELVKRSERKSQIEVVSASPLSEKQVAELLKKNAYKHILSSTHKRVIRRVDDTLVSGAVVRTSDTRVDGSAKSALEEMYRSMTNSL